MSLCRRPPPLLPFPFSQTFSFLHLFFQRSKHKSVLDEQIQPPKGKRGGQQAIRRQQSMSRSMTGWCPRKSAEEGCQGGGGRKHLSRSAKSFAKQYTKLSSFSLTPPLAAGCSTRFFSFGGLSLRFLAFSPVGDSFGLYERANAHASGAWTAPCVCVCVHVCVCVCVRASECPLACQAHTLLTIENGRPDVLTMRRFRGIFRSSTS